jgi:outer membrane protein assembly factor BamB
MGDVSGQQPKEKAEPQPAPLLPAEQAWVRELPALPAAASALDGEHVYIPLQDSGVLALARETGEAAWTNVLGTPWPVLLSSRGVVVIATDEAAAVDRASGASLWRVPLPARSVAPAVVAGDLIAVPLETETLVALRGIDGTTAWSLPIEGLTTRVELTADSDTIYVTTAGSRVIAISATSGKVRWRVTLDGSLSAPAVAKDRVFVGSTTNAFYALDPDTGKVEWQWGHGMIGGDVIGAGVDGELIVFAGLDNLLHAVNRSNGNQRWKQPTPARPLAPPQTFDGVVAVFGVSPAIATFSAKTGTPIGTYVIPTVTGAVTAPVPKGPPLVDPALRPFKVAIVVVTTDGRAIGLRPTGMMFRDQPLVPLAALPGRPLQRERPPAVGRP